MDAQELRNLQEAYMEVVENQQLDEVSLKTASSAYDERKHREMTTPSNPKNVTKSGEDKSDATFRRVRKKYGQRAAKKMRDENPYNRYENYDIYDIILSHLLDEGYAETLESAEAIMVNMSEEWRENIVEELTGERRKRAEEKLSTYKPNDPRASALTKTIRYKEGSRIGTGKFPTKRGGYGKKGEMKAYSLGGGSDRGEGNKAARRAGKSVQDTRGD